MVRMAFLKIFVPPLKIKVYLDLKYLTHTHMYIHTYTYIHTYILAQSIPVSLLKFTYERGTPLRDKFHRIVHMDSMENKCLYSTVPANEGLIT